MKINNKYLPIGLIILLGSLFFLYYYNKSHYTFDLEDRHAHIIGIDTATLLPASEIYYKSDDVYRVIVKIKKIKTFAGSEPNNTKFYMPSRIKYDTFVIKSPSFSPYRFGTNITINGANSNAVDAGKEGETAEVVFMKADNSFADFCKLRQQEPLGATSQNAQPVP